MSFATNMQRTAKKLIDKFGSNVKLVKTGSYSYDPSTGGQSRTETLTDAKAALSNFTVQEAESMNVHEGDIKCLVRTDIEMTTNDQIEISGQRWEIVFVVKTIAQDTQIVQSLQIRALKD